MSAAKSLSAWKPRLIVLVFLIENELDQILNWLGELGVGRRLVALLIGAICFIGICAILAIFVV
jgi:hypothetical protein